MSSCCDDPSHGHEEHENDPTLASCCARDLAQQKRSAELKAFLVEHDVSSGAVRQKKAIVGEPVMLSHQQQQNPFESDDEFEDDEFLKQLQTDRFRHLQVEVEKTKQLNAIGFKMIQQVEIATLKAELINQRHVPKVVVVTKNSNGQIEQELSRQMKDLCRKYIGTRFLLLQIRENDPAMYDLGVSICPTILAYRNGDRVDRYDSWKSSHPDRIAAWLENCNVLSEEEPKLVAKSPKQMDEEEMDRDDGYDCGKEGCRIRFSYSHEHIGASDESKQTAADWR